MATHRSGEMLVKTETPNEQKSKVCNDYVSEIVQKYIAELEGKIKKLEYENADLKKQLFSAVGVGVVDMGQ